MAKEQELLRLRNARVVDVNGERIGKVGEIFLHDRSQDITFVTVSLGLFRSREVYVPYALLDLTEDVIVAQVPRSFLESAPRSNGSGHLTVQQESELEAYYGLHEPAIAGAAAARTAPRPGLKTP